MNSEVYLVVEGLTEQLFVEHVLAPYCAMQGIYLHPTQVPKKGGKGNFDDWLTRLGCNRVS